MIHRGETLLAYVFNIQSAAITLDVKQGSAYYVADIAVIGGMTVIGKKITQEEQKDWDALDDFRSPFGQ